MRRKPLPKIRCDAVDSAYFGYGPTEYHECTSPAEFRGWWDDDRYFPIPGGRERVRLCSWHARRETGIKVYRFRRVS
jgi:hypothetical protein